MNAAERISQLDKLDANELCDKANEKLSALVDIMNKETILLREGHLKEAGELSAEKTQLSQDYVVLARAVKRASERLKRQAPKKLIKLQQQHESFATQMAENLRVLASAKKVAEDILTDVAKTVGKNSKPKTYDTSGHISNRNVELARGLSIDKAL